MDAWEECEWTQRDSSQKFGGVPTVFWGFVMPAGLPLFYNDTKGDTKKRPNRVAIVRLSIYSAPFVVKLTTENTKEVPGSFIVEIRYNYVR